MDSSQAVVDELSRRFKPEACRNMRATYLINVRGVQNGAWLTKIDDGSVDFSQVDATEAEENGKKIADCVISIDKEDLADIISGKMKAMTAAMSGVLNIEGDITKAMKLVPIFFS